MAAKLRAAGVIIIGKTNMHELGSEFPDTIPRSRPAANSAKIAGVLPCPRLVCFIHFAREAAGALFTRHFPAPLGFWAKIGA
jgi:hypothetical protein